MGICERHTIEIFPVLGIAVASHSLGKAFRRPRAWSGSCFFGEAWMRS